MFEILGHLLYHLIRRSLICTIVTEKGVQCISLNGTTYAATTLVFNEDCRTSAPGFAWTYVTLPSSTVDDGLVTKFCFAGVSVKLIHIRSS